MKDRYYTMTDTTTHAISIAPIRSGHRGGFHAALKINKGVDLADVDAYVRKCAHTILSGLTSELADKNSEGYKIMYDEIVSLFSESLAR